jgi:hypothetical protein
MDHLCGTGLTLLLEDSSAAYIVRVWVEHLEEIARFIRPFLEAMGVTFGKPTDGYVGHSAPYELTYSHSAQENPSE